MALCVDTSSFYTNSHRRADSMLNLRFLLLFLISAASRSAQERPVTIRVGTLLRHGREEFILQLTCLLRPGTRLASFCSETLEAMLGAGFGRSQVSRC
jgi:hypothetical protein